MLNNHAVQQIDPLPPFISTNTATTTRSRGEGEPLLRSAEFDDVYNARSPETTEGQTPGWRAEVVPKLAAYTELEKGWDSYSGCPLRGDVAQFAVDVLTEIMQSGTPVPDVVPGSDGGVQLEWHEKGIDLEVYISAPYELEVWFEDHRTGQSRSEELSNDFSSLAGPITELTPR